MNSEAEKDAEEDQNAITIISTQNSRRGRSRFIRRSSQLYYILIITRYCNMLPMRTLPYPREAQNVRGCPLCARGGLRPQRLSQLSRARAERNYE